MFDGVGDEQQTTPARACFISTDQRAKLSSRADAPLGSRGSVGSRANIRRRPPSRQSRPSLRRWHKRGDRKGRCLLHCICLLLPQSGHLATEFRCPLLGVKRTLRHYHTSKMVHAALLHLMLEAANARPRFTISLKRRTPNLQISITTPGRLPHLLAQSGHQRTPKRCLLITQSGNLATRSLVCRLNTSGWRVPPGSGS